MNSLLLALISIGDSAVAGGIALVGAAFLAATRNVRAAAILFAAVVIAGGAIGTLKALFIGCDMYLNQLDIRFPSGHAALSAAALGTICVLIASRLIGWQRLAVLIGFAALEATIATTLVRMGFHTFYEVVLGLIVGGSASAGAYLAIRRGKDKVSPIRVRGFAVALVAVVVLMGAGGLRSGDLAGWLGAQIQTRTSVCRLYTPTPIPDSTRTRAQQQGVAAVAMPAADQDS